MYIGREFHNMDAQTIHEVCLCVHHGKNKRSTRWNRWDASPLQDYPQHIYTWVERSTLTVKCLTLAQEHNTLDVCPRPGLESGPLAPESSTLTLRPPRLHKNGCWMLPCNNFFNCYWIRVTAIHQFMWVVVCTAQLSHFCPNCHNIGTSILSFNHKSITLTMGLTHHCTF